MTKRRRSRAYLVTTALVLALPGIAGAQHLVGQWNFDGNQIGSSGMNNRAIQSGGPAYARSKDAAGRDGQALDLRGRSVTIPNSPNLQTNEFTVSYRVYMSSPQNYMPVASKGTDAGSAAWQTNIVAGVDLDGRAIGGQSLEFCVGGTCKTSAALSRDPVGRWMEVSFSYDGKTANAWADGTAVLTFTAQALPGNSTADIQLGNSSGSTGGNSNSLLRDLRIYDGPLAPLLRSLATSGASLGTNAITLGRAAASSSVVLSAPAAWTATANDSFLHITAGSASGSASALVLFSIDAFSGTGSRTGTLTIAGLTLTVTQAGTDYTAVTTGSVAASIPDRAYNVAVDSAGNLYVTDSSSLSKITLPSRAVTTLATGFSGPTGIALDASGNIYIADTGHNVIKKWTASTQQVTTLISGLNGPTGIAVDGSGNLYIADYNNQAVKKWTLSTQQITVLATGQNFHGVAVDSAGNVYFTELLNGRLDKWAASTQQVSTLASGLGHPSGLVVDGQGNLYFMTYYGYLTSDTAYPAQVAKWTAGNQQVTTLLETVPFNSNANYGIGAVDRGVAVGPTGNVYVASYAYLKVFELPYALAPSSTLSRPVAAGASALPPVLPVTTDLTGVFAPSSNQSWLTVGSIVNGIVNFSYSATPGVARTGQIYVLGVPSSITQNTTTVPDVAGRTQAVATAAITSAYLTTGAVSSAISATVAAGNAISTWPVAGTQLVLGAPVNLLVSVGPNSLGSTTLQAGSAVGNFSVFLTAAGAWTASSNSAFLHLGSGSVAGTGSALVYFKTDAFAATGTRTGTLTIAGMTFTVTQFGTNYVPSQSAVTISGGTFGQAVAVAADASGNFYVADNGNDHRVYKWVSPNNRITLAQLYSDPAGVAVDTKGNVYYSADNIPSVGDDVLYNEGNSVRVWNATNGNNVTPLTALRAPHGVAVDRSGNVYVADTGHDAVVKWNVTTGVVVTLVSGLSGPWGVAVDGSDNVYIANRTGSTIQVWTAATGQLSTVISSGLNSPRGVAVDGYGNLYIADTDNQQVKKWTAATGQMTVVESSGPYRSPFGVALDPAGNLYCAFYSTYGYVTYTDLSSSDSAVKTYFFGFQQVAAVPDVTGQTQAAASSAITGAGFTVGTVTAVLSASIPVGSVIGTNPAAGTVVNIGTAVNVVISGAPRQVPDVVNLTQAAASTAITGAGLVVGTVTTAISSTVATGNVIGTNPAAGITVVIGSSVSLVVSLGSVVPDVIGQTQAAAASTVTGAGLTVGSITTTVSLTGLSNPGGLISDVAGNVYIADTGNNAIKKWNAVTAQLTTLVSTGLNQPGGIGLDKAGNVYIADTGNNAIKKWTAATNQVTTLVSTGLNHPHGIVVDRYIAGTYAQLGSQQIQSKGDVYIADTGNNAIKVWTAATQQVTTLISTQLNQPAGVAYCAGYGLVIADTGNNAIKTLFGSQLSTVPLAGLNHPSGLACAAYTDNATAFFNYATSFGPVDFIPYADIFIADTGNNMVKYARTQGNIGTPVWVSSLHQPLAVTSDGLDTVWVADTGSNALVRVPSGCGAQRAGNCNNGALTTIKSTLVRSVPAGTVLTTIPEAGTAANIGTVVNLVVEAAAGSAALSGSSILLGNTGGSSSVFLITPDTGVPWSASANDSFLHLSPGSGSGNASSWIAFTVDASTSTGVRTGTLTIAGLTFTVIQAGVDYSAASPLATPISGSFNKPDGVAVDGFGNVYIADTLNNAIKKWTPSTRQISTVISSGLTSPHAVAVDGFGNLYIGDVSTLQKWSAANQQLSILVSGTSTVSGVALDPAGNVYYSVGNTSISKWTAATQQVSTVVSTSVSTNRGVALDSYGNIFFAVSLGTDGVGNAINQWSAPAGPLTNLVTAGLKGTWGVALDPTGDLYFSDLRNSAVRKWSAGTQQVTTLVTGSPVGITNRYKGLALDTFGNLYFAQTDANVIGQLAKAYVSSGSLSEPNTAGTDALPPVIPVTTDLTGAFAPTSDQAWLTIGGVANGIVTFSFAANGAGVPRTGHITVLGVPFTINQGQVAVPDVTGNTQAAAATAINAAGLVVGTVTTASSDTVAGGSVIGTNPAAGTQVNQGSAVNLVVSTGLAQVAVPNVVGQTQAAAAAAVTGAGLVVGTVTTASSGTVAVGNVISTSPSVATQVSVGSAVDLLVSTGPAQVTLPNVVGQTQAMAAAALTGAGLVVGTVTTASSATVPAGSVISTSPSAGTQVSVGSAVNLLVSMGPAQVAVPNVVGQTQAMAATAITGAGLVVGTVTTASSASVPAGSVISTSPLAGTQVRVGSAVNLLVSTGPAQVAVPDVVDQTQVAATASIAGAGLAVGTVTMASSSTVAAGNVISTNPAAGTQVNLSSAVNLVVSTGPAQVPAPDVTGQFTVARGALVLNRATGRYTQSVTVSNSGAAMSSAAFVLDNLASGYALYQPAGLTVATTPVGSAFKEIGAIGAGAALTFTLELTRTGTPALTYTSRVLGLGAR